MSSHRTHRARLPVAASLAHALSRPFAIDPAYSARACFPPRESYPLAAGEAGRGELALRVPADVEAFLLARMKLATFRDAREVAHPGLYRVSATTAYFRRDFEWKGASIPAVKLGFRGTIRIALNDRAVFQDATSLPALCHDVSLFEKCRPGKNRLHISVNSLGLPPAFCLSHRA